MVIATGFFDGVHEGHRYFVKQLTELARSRNEESVILSFWPHPRNVLQNLAYNLRLLTDREEKKTKLLELGVDRVEFVEFTKRFSCMTAGQYISDFLQNRYGKISLLAGYDNRLGSDKCGGEKLIETAYSLGVEAFLAKPFTSKEGIVISSTKIRNLLSEGKVELASLLLGYKYTLHGVVVPGFRIGRTLGFPTANMQLYEPLKLVPGRGVYMVEVRTVGRTMFGMCNIGVRPTVSAGESMTIETNIFGFDEDIYGLDIEISFLEKIRGEKRFDDVEGLKKQLHEDRQYCLSGINKIK